MPMDKEYIIYCILLFAMMLSGYLDDAAKTPWSDYKKGAIDLRAFDHDRSDVP